MPYGLSYHEVVLADSPVAYYRMSEGGGLVLNDSSGNGRNGAYAGGVTLAQPGAIVRSDDSAARFNGGTGRATVVDQAGLDLGDTVTVEAWVKAAVAGQTAVIVEKGTNAYFLGLSAGAPLWAKSGVANIATATVTLDDLQWHHVVATKATTTNKIYVDGVDVTGAVTNAALADTAVDLQIAQLANGTIRFNGWLDEVAIYGTALSAARVTAHFLRGMNIPTAGVAALPSRERVGAVLFNPGVASPDRWVRYASYGAGVLTPWAVPMGVEVLTVAQAEQRPWKKVIALTRFAPGTVVPSNYRLISELAAED